MLAGQAGDGGVQDVGADRGGAEDGEVPAGRGVERERRRGQAHVDGAPDHPVACHAVAGPHQAEYATSPPLNTGARTVTV